jgi:hypothetical protein
MKDHLYPALYESADSASNRTQRILVGITKAYLILATASVAANTFLPKASWAAVITAALLLLTMLVPVFMIFRKYSDTWYRARALAESIKTATWKFMMHSEPFNMPESDAKSHFQNLLKRLLEEHKMLSEAFGEQSRISQISSKMLQIRRSNMHERVSFYRSDRIEEQHNWYRNKAVSNKRSACIWLTLTISFHAIAVLLALIQISSPTHNWPIALFVVLGSSAISWMQFKKFGELGAAYALTAQEISIAAEGLVEVDSEEALSSVVADIENAFSREHTQWIARKDQR